MKQKEKDLLLKDLCARLPYGVKIVIQDTFKYSIASREYHVLDISNFSDIFCFNYKKFDKRMKKAMRERPNDIVIKPYLFPLSSMTEDQKKEYNERKHLVPTCHYEYGEVVEEYELWDSPWSFQYLIENHFDYRGLIEMGLALKAPDGMYNQNIQKMPYKYFPIEFSSYEDYVRYLKEKGLAIDCITH